MKRFVMHTLALACMAAAAGPALADASSSAAFGNLVITLTDLDTGDGIAPSLTFNLNGPSFIDSRAEGFGEVSESYQFQNYAPQQGGLFTGETHSAWSSSVGSIMTANNVAGFTWMSAEGAAHSALDAYGTYRAASIGATPENTFTLSANTAVTFSVTADMHARTSMGYNLEADMAEYATSHALLNVGGMVNGTFVTDAQERYIDAGFDVLDDNTVVGVSNSWDGVLSASFANTGGAETSGFLQTFVIVEGYSSVWDGVTPVPEPGTYAMLLGGLALLGVAARRRKA
ncbi:PEP-CTERM sorting domain-containing protein [Pseudoduganella albidiflava]|uniref:Ice-binding protein C-terminal domain-containing protein n=1 Tax=Pseudoduganella albidiflava TaxID=321983 RepID=A0AA87XXH6_9BURK|nr:PEP-CTERM sorting domain-containing protein [Pseudoduganella albidiflava]GGY46485.1 hypothetical protein GCM10007387_30780 [Pseudoduganella albidiflava]